MIDTPIVLPQDSTLPQSLASALAAHQAGNHLDARLGYSEFLDNHPNHPQALAFLGVLTAQAGDFDRAANLLTAALRGNPDLGDARYCLGTIFLRNGKAEDGIGYFVYAMLLGHARAKQQLERILPISGKTGQARCFLAMAEFYFSHGRPVEAFVNICKVIHLEPDKDQHWFAFSHYLSRIRFTMPVKPTIQADIARAFLRDNVDYRRMVRATISIFRNDECLAPLFQKASPGNDINEFLDVYFNERMSGKISRNNLLCNMLQSSVVTDVGFEGILTALRRFILNRVPPTADLPPEGAGLMRLACSIAHQCFLNEYAWQTTLGEEEGLQRLETEIVNNLQNGDDIPELMIAVLGTYKSLASINCSRTCCRANGRASLHR